MVVEVGTKVLRDDANALCLGLRLQAPLCPHLLRPDPSPNLHQRSIANITAVGSTTKKSALREKSESVKHHHRHHHRHDGKRLRPVARHVKAASQRSRFERTGVADEGSPRHDNHNELALMMRKALVYAQLQAQQYS